ncbi:MAG: heme-binding protein [Planctomycetota bacterium]
MGTSSMTGWLIKPLTCVAALFSLACTGTPADVVVLSAEEAAERRGAEAGTEEADMHHHIEPIRRVGGDAEAVARVVDGQWRAGASFIEESLPVGYADPTPPGAIDIKGYAPVRRAQLTMTGVDRENAGALGNVGFFPLFNHIKRRDIAMTSPVESEYDGMTLVSLEDVVAAEKAQNAPADGESDADVSMAMSFLYRNPELGPTGIDERDPRIEVIDTEPVIVLSIGYRGPYGLRLLDDEREALAAWLDETPDWEIDDSATFSMRVLSYNGPYVPRRIRWGELQVPVRPVQAPGGDAETTPASDGPDSTDE